MCILLAPATQAFAADTNNAAKTQQTINGEISPRGKTGPPYYEYKTTPSATLYKSDLDTWRLAAKQAKDQNTTTNYVKLATVITNLVYPTTSAGLSRVSDMMKSDLDPLGTLEYVSDRFSFMMDYSQYTSCNVQVQYKRFFDGLNMRDWYPIKSPIHISYNYRN